MSAIVSVASSAGTPNSHGVSSPWRLPSLHSELASSSASTGFGKTIRFSLSLRHGVTGSRDSAPKQRGSGFCGASVWAKAMPASGTAASRTRRSAARRTGRTRAI